jgi:predicted TIM-barrel fold metal-dependent hydrolase
MIQKIDKNLRKPSEYFKSNIYVDCMGPSAIALKAMIAACGVDRVLFGTDFGPVPMSPKLHIDLVDDTIADPADRDKIFFNQRSYFVTFNPAKARVSCEVGLTILRGSSTSEWKRNDHS